MITKLIKTAVINLYAPIKLAQYERQKWLEIQRLLLKNNKGLCVIILSLKMCTVGLMEESAKL